jgi:transposase-like protein
MREMSVAEQRYKAVLAVIADGRTVTEVARDWGVSRQTMHVWLARYEEGLEGLSNRSHRPAHSPHQMPAAWEAKVLETRRAKPYWGARRLALELTRKGGAEPPLSESAVYRCLVRAASSRSSVAGGAKPVKHQPKVDTSTNMLCLLAYWTTHLAVAPAAVR